MQEYEVKVTEYAEDALRGIGQYILNELKAPQAAINTLQAIRKEIKTLNHMPSRVHLTVEPHEKRTAFYSVADNSRIRSGQNSILKRTRFASKTDRLRMKCGRNSHVIRTRSATFVNESFIFIVKPYIIGRC